MTKIISFIVAILFWYFKHKWKTAEGIVSLEVALMTQYFQCSLTPWNFPLVTISFSVTSKHSCCHSPQTGTSPYGKNVWCWTLSFACMFLSFTLVWVCFQICLLGGNFIKMNLYEVLCHYLLLTWVKPFVSVANFIQSQQGNLSWPWCWI